MPLKLKKGYVDLSYVDPFFHKMENESDLDLSEEFLSAIIKCVEDLSILITNGDPNIERTIEVNQNLNNAVNCYREILNERAESKYQEQFRYEEDANLNPDSESEWLPKKKSKKKETLNGKTKTWYGHPRRH